jgi:hypothetical protein
LSEKKASRGRFLFLLVRGRGLEPPRLAALVPKTSVSTISPPARAAGGFYPRFPIDNFGISQDFITASFFKI